MQTIFPLKKFYSVLKTTATKPDASDFKAIFIFTYPNDV